MSTIYGVAKTVEHSAALAASLRANGIDQASILIVLPTDGPVPKDANSATAIADDFSGDPKARLVGGVVGAAVGVGVLAASLIPGVTAIGPAVAAVGATVSGTAGGALGALIGSAIGESKIEHYEKRLKEGCRMVIAKVSDNSSDQFVGLYVREGLEDISVRMDAEDVDT